MSVYSELLRMVVDQEDEVVSDLPGLVAEVLKLRAELHDAAAARPLNRCVEFGSSLVYDAALVRLCRGLGIDEALTAGVAVNAARTSAEKRVAELLPSIATALVAEPA